MISLVLPHEAHTEAETPRVGEILRRPPCTWCGLPCDAVAMIRLLGFTLRGTVPLTEIVTGTPNAR